MIGNPDLNCKAVSGNVTCYSGKIYQTKSTIQTQTMKEKWCQAATLYNYANKQNLQGRLKHVAVCFLASCLPIWPQLGFFDSCLSRRLVKSVQLHHSGCMSWSQNRDSASQRPLRGNVGFSYSASTIRYYHQFSHWIRKNMEKTSLFMWTEWVHSSKLECGLVKSLTEWILWGMPVFKMQMRLDSDCHKFSLWLSLIWGHCQDVIM